MKLVSTERNITFIIEYISENNSQSFNTKLQHFLLAILPLLLGLFFVDSNFSFLLVIFVSLIGRSSKFIKNSICSRLTLSCWSFDSQGFFSSSSKAPNLTLSTLSSTDLTDLDLTDLEYPTGRESRQIRPRRRSPKDRCENFTALGSSACGATMFWKVTVLLPGGTIWMTLSPVLTGVEVWRGTGWLTVFPVLTGVPPDRL